MEERLVHRRPARFAVAALVVVLSLIAAACGGDDDINSSFGAGGGDESDSTDERDTPRTDDEDTPRTDREDQSDDEPSGDITGVGTPTDCGPEDYDDVVCDALESVQGYWIETFPEVFGDDYQPIEGGFHPYTSESEQPPCGDPAPSYDDIAVNAFYCPSADLIAWDDENLIPQLFEQFGPFTLGIVFAHEFGHAIQSRVDYLEPTVIEENQADCYAGAWVAWAADTGDSNFEVTDEALDIAVAGFLTLADAPGTSERDPLAHGNAFDRVSAFQDGIESGATKCAEYTLDNVSITEMEFSSPEEEANAGNLPLDEVLDLVIVDLEDFWATVFPAEFGAEWVPITDFVAYDGEAEVLTCGGVEVDQEFSLGNAWYCAADDYIAWDEPGLFAPVITEIGDFAVGMLIANQYAQAAGVRLGIEEFDQATLLQVDCLSGAWAGNAAHRDPDTSVSGLTLSPGDLDEAIVAFLIFGSATEPGDDMTNRAFARVDAFREGFVTGVQTCLS
jgi:predicted metalloprotease